MSIDVFFKFVQFSLEESNDKQSIRNSIIDAYRFIIEHGEHIVYELYDELSDSFKGKHYWINNELYNTYHLRLKGLGLKHQDVWNDILRNEELN